MNLKDLQKETKKLANPKKAKSYQWFFKTGKGEYGEGDEFYGITVPESRKVAKKYKDLSFSELQILIKSRIHEERLIALLILAYQYQKGDDKLKQKIVAHIGYHFKKSGRDRHVIDLGWIVHPDYEGQGIGSKMLKSILEDAKKRGFKRAEAEMAIKNIGSWKIALKNGFKIEGIKKKALLTDDGEYIDTYIVGKIL